MTNKNSLLFFRNKINNIDKNIVKLLAERKNLVLKIAQSKIKNNQSIRDLDREKKMLKELSILGEKYDLQTGYVTQLFQLIIEESVFIQKKILKKFHQDNNSNNSNCSFLGPKGSYSHIAACEYENRILKTFNMKEYSTFKEVLLSVENHQSDYAILPIENTCSGLIDEVLNSLEKTNLFIIGEINLFINHCLLAIEKIELDKIQKIYSHPQPFKQCSHFIKQFPQWQMKYTNSTASAMKKISEYNEKTYAVLGSEIGGKIYGLQVLSRNLANNKNNITRFIILHRNPIKISNTTLHKTTLLFTSEKNSETLSKVLSILEEQKIIINQLTSQVSKHNSWKEIFYIDIQVYLLSTLMQDTLKKIKKVTKFIKILGCYPCESTMLITP